MKFFPLVVLSLFTIPAQAQSLLDALSQHQAALPAEPGVTLERPAPGITAPTTRPSDVNTRCEESKQTSLPLKYLSGLLLSRDAQLDISHDPASGTLRVSSASKMIGNCNSMIQWHVRENEIEGRKTYAVEAKFKDGEACPAEITNAGDKKCYRVAKIDGDIPKFEMHPFDNDIQGFQRCLEVSGVVGADRKINPAAIYKQPVQESFSGLEETGRLMFLSHGPVSSQVDARFGVERVNGCDVYEKIHPSITMVYSSADLDRQRLDAQAAELRNCPVNEYQRVADFLDRYDGYMDTLGQVRDSLILTAARDVAKKIAENKELTEDDLKVIGDFERYIVEPKRRQIAELFAQMENLEGSELQNARTRLNTLRGELEAMGRAPYFLAAHVSKLLEKGLFAEAEKLEGIRITVAETAKIGKREGNVTVTPEMAQERIALAKGQVADQVVQARENYDIRTGVTTGVAQTYVDLAANMRRNIQQRTQNYNQEIMAEYARIQQPNGYCFQWFRNAQRCVQDSLQRIQELQTALQHYNNIDQQRAAEYDQKAQEYGRLEDEGRTYVARQNGEEPPRQSPQDTTTPAPRQPEQQGPQNAPWMQGGQQGMAMNPYQNPQMMMQQNPFSGMYGSQNSSWMGQAGFQAGFGYQGAMGQQPMFGQQPMYGQQQMFGQQPMFGQQFGQPQFGQQFGQQPMYGQQFGQPQFGAQQGFGMQAGFGMPQQSPFGQMYSQSPYLQQGGFGQQAGFGQGAPWMNQGMQYPNFYR